MSKKPDRHFTRGGSLLPPEAAESREATRIYRDTLLIHQLQDHKLI